MNEHHLPVPKTARYFTLGAAGEHTKEVWFVCHGYGQLGKYFLKHFESIEQKERLIVAPEGQSRFYLSGFSGRIGASWMTREDRLADIKDYVVFLDAIYEKIVVPLKPSVRIVVLGFSQGTATVSRWLALGEVRCHRLILWAGLLPPDLDLPRCKSHFENTQLTFVIGTDDEYANQELLSQQTLQLKDAGIRHRIVRFDGGHTIDKQVLEKLAAG